MDYVIGYGSLALFVVGWCFIKFFITHKRYLVPYLIFQLGITLLVSSLFLMDGWAAMGYAILSLYIIGFGIITSILIFIFTIIRFKIKND